jgi:ABC-2 type transport system permease protein
LVITAFFGLYMKVLVDDAWGRRFGDLTAQAAASGVDADWSGYLRIMTQAVAVGGLLIFGLVHIWLFGREFADRTAKDLLALPVPTLTIVAAKFVVGAAWCGVLATSMLLGAMVMGTTVGLSGMSGSVLLDAGGRYAAVAALTIALCTVFGVATSVGRGYLVGVGVLLALVFVGQIFASAGIGGWFPWSVPTLMTSVDDARSEDVVPAASYAVAVGVAGALAVATRAYWSRADQH